MPTSTLEITVREMFEKHYLGLVEFAYRLVGCNDMARDIVQEIFVKLLEGKVTILPDDTKVKSFLFTIVKNASLNKIRWNKVRVEYAERQMLEADIIESNILDAMIYAEAINQLHAAMQSLPKACQNVCYLSFVEEKSNQEVAEITQTSVNTVKSHKQRAIKMLRDILSPTLGPIKILILFFYTNSFILFHPIGVLLLRWIQLILE